MNEEYEMVLRPRLIESSMLLRLKLERKMVPVLEWKGAGLAIHQYHDTIDKRYHWRISHMDSGRSILRYIRSKEQCIEYLMRVRKIHKDWNITEGQFLELPNRSEIKEKIDVIQKEISGVRR